MIRIQLTGGTLDTYPDENIEITWTTVRFAKGLRDPYTNDFNIPKTKNNINILGAYGLIDSEGQLFGTAFAPATVTGKDGVPRSVKIQVAAVTEKDIKICLYETVIDPETMGKSIGSLFTDDVNSTVFRWYRNTLSEYPNWFKKYDAGSSLNTYAYQLHPCKKLNEIVNSINSVYHYNLPTDNYAIQPDQYLIATKKNVCPQNTRQSIMGVYAPVDTDTTDDMRNTLKLVGGQHISNDMSGYSRTPTQTAVTYNRYVHVFGQIHVSWLMPSSYGTYRLQIIRNSSEVIHTIYITVPSDKTNGVVSSGNIDFTVNSGDTISFRLAAPHYFNNICILADMINNFYQIREDDYSQDLVYAANPPYLTLYQYYDQGGNHEVKCWANGSTYTVRDNSNGTSTMSYSLPKLAMSYFGFWCNLPKITIKDLLFEICWLSGRKLVVDSDRLKFVYAWDTEEIKGTITELRPISSHLGQYSTIGYKNADSPLTIHFDSVWLDKTKSIHTSIFEYVRGKKIADHPNASPMGIIDQYKWHYDDEGYSVGEFNDIENPVLMILVAWSGSTYLAPPRNLNSMGFTELSKVMEADIYCPNQIIRDPDYLSLNGHRFMAISGTVSANSNSTKLKALLMD